jgi:hypothetical protein
MLLVQALSRVARSGVTHGMGVKEAPERGPNEANKENEPTRLKPFKMCGMDRSRLKLPEICHAEGHGASRNKSEPVEEVGKRAVPARENVASRALIEVRSFCEPSRSLSRTEAHRL